MKLVYSSMLEEMSCMAVQRSCALLGIPKVNKKQYLKYKSEVVRIGKEEN